MFNLSIYKYGKNKYIHIPCQKSHADTDGTNKRELEEND
jgi:hypothetical protein